MRFTALAAALGVALLAGLAGGPRPAAAQGAPPDPRFGIVEAFVNTPAANAAGAGYSRIILRWDIVQPAGPADWRPANVPDPLIQAELDAGRQVVALLIGTPAWAAVEPGDGARAVPRLDAWFSFVKGMAQQYRGRIHNWIIWNEPDVWDDEHPGSQWAGTEQDYKELLKTAYLAIKEVDPNMQVSLAGLTYFWDAIYGRRQYLDRLLDAIVADPEAPAHGYYFDVAVYHLYFKPRQAPEVIATARQILAGHGITGKEVWINETNAPPSSDARELPWSAPRFTISPAEQSAFLLQEFSLGFAAGAQRMEVYKLRNGPLGPGSIEPFGLLRADDSPRPALTAYRVATTYLRDFRTAHLEQQGDVYAVVFDRGSRTTTVLWTVGRTAAAVTVRAAAASAALVDEAGQEQWLAAAGAAYRISLPAAACSGGDCFIGGAPRLLVEEAPASGRPALLAVTAAGAGSGPRPRSPRVGRAPIAE